MVEMVIEDHISKRSRHVNDLPPMYFLPRTWFWDYCPRDMGKIFPAQIWEQNVRLSLLRPSIGSLLESIFWVTRSVKYKQL